MTDATVNPRRLIPRKDGFKKLNVGPTKGHALINSGRIRAYKMGGKTLLDEDSIDAFLASLPDARSPRPARDAA